MIGQIKCKDFTRKRLGKLLSSDDVIIKNNALSILKQLQRKQEKNATKLLTPIEQAETPKP